MGYEIRIVSNEEFDTLPYKGAKTALGLADAKAGVAYIRETGVRELDDATINHEFDELVSKISPHEEDGIRYKSGSGLGKIFGPIVGTILSAVASPWIGVPVGAAISGGTQAHSQSVKPDKYGSGFGGIAKSAALGGIGSYLGGNALSGGMAGFSKAPAGFMNKAGGFLSGATGIGGGGAAAANPAAQGLTQGSNAVMTGTSGIPLSMSGAPAMSLASGGTSAAAAKAASAAASPSLFNKFAGYAGEAAKKGATSLATETALGTLAPPQQQSTLFPTGRTPAGGGGGAYGITGGGNTLDIFNPKLLQSASFNPISQDEYNLGLSNLRNAKQTSITDLFKRPSFRGQSPEENTALAGQLASLNKGFDQSFNQYNLDVDDANLMRNYKAVQQANKFTNDQMNEYIKLAQGDDAGISARFSNSPDEFRQIFGKLKPLNA